MSLKGWLLETGARRELKRAEEGKDGPEMQQTIQFLKTHKREASGLVAAAIGYLYYTGHAAIAGNLVAVATFLAGAGFLESDAFHKEQ